MQYVNSYISQRNNLLSQLVEALYHQHVYHLFTVRHPKRNYIIKMLNRKNIGTRIIYPFPINKMKGYKKFNFNDKELKKTIKYSKEIFSLPLYPELKVSEVKNICNNLKEILKKIN